MQKMRWPILFIFYKNFYWMTIGISLFTCVLFWQSGDPRTIVTFLWTKLITNALAILFMHIFSKDKLYFFNNLGYSAQRLYTLSFLLDILLWALLIILTFLFL